MTEDMQTFPIDWYAVLRESAQARVRERRQLESTGTTSTQVTTSAFMEPPRRRIFLNPGCSSSVRVEVADETSTLRVRVVGYKGDNDGAELAYWDKHWPELPVVSSSLELGLVGTLTPNACSMEDHDAATSLSTTSSSTELVVVAVGVTASSTIFDEIAPNLIEDVASRMAVPNGLILTVTAAKRDETKVVARETRTGSISAAVRVEHLLSKARDRCPGVVLTIEVAADAAASRLSRRIHLAVVDTSADAIMEPTAIVQLLCGEMTRDAVWTLLACVSASNMDLAALGWVNADAADVVAADVASFTAANNMRRPLSVAALVRQSPNPSTTWEKAKASLIAHGCMCRSEDGKSRRVRRNEDTTPLADHDAQEDDESAGTAYFLPPSSYEDDAEVHEVLAAATTDSDRLWQERNYQQHELPQLLSKSNILVSHDLPAVVHGDGQLEEDDRSAARLSVLCASMRDPTETIEATKATRLADERIMCLHGASRDSERARDVANQTARAAVVTSLKETTLRPTNVLEFEGMQDANAHTEYLGSPASPEMETETAAPTTAVADDVQRTAHMTCAATLHLVEVRAHTNKFHVKIDGRDENEKQAAHDHEENPKRGDIGATLLSELERRADSLKVALAIARAEAKEATDATERERRAARYAVDRIRAVAMRELEDALREVRDSVTAQANAARRSLRSLAKERDALVKARERECSALDEARKGVPAFERDARFKAPPELTRPTHLETHDSLLDVYSKTSPVAVAGARDGDVSYRGDRTGRWATADDDKRLNNQDNDLDAFIFVNKKNNTTSTSRDTSQDDTTKVHVLEEMLRTRERELDELRASSRREAAALWLAIGRAEDAFHTPETNIREEPHASVVSVRDSNSSPGILAPTTAHFETGVPVVDDQRYDEDTSDDELALTSELHGLDKRLASLRMSNTEGNGFQPPPSVRVAIRPRLTNTNGLGPKRTVERVEKTNRDVLDFLELSARQSLSPARILAREGPTY